MVLNFMIHLSGLSSLLGNAFEKGTSDAKRARFHFFGEQAAQFVDLKELDRKERTLGGNRIEKHQADPYLFSLPGPAVESPWTTPGGLANLFVLLCIWLTHRK
jgi:hypothetical protein